MDSVSEGGDIELQLAEQQLELDAGWSNQSDDEVPVVAADAVAAADVGEATRLPPHS